MTDDLIPLAHKPTGPLWKRILDAFRLAVENVKIRRMEHGDDEHLLDDLEDLATKDDRKGDTGR